MCSIRPFASPQMFNEIILQTKVCITIIYLFYSIFVLLNLKHEFTTYINYMFFKTWLGQSKIKYVQTMYYLHNLLVKMINGNNQTQNKIIIHSIFMWVKKHLIFLNYCALIFKLPIIKIGWKYFFKMQVTFEVHFLQCYICLKYV